MAEQPTVENETAMQVVDCMRDHADAIGDKNFNTAESYYAEHDKAETLLRYADRLEKAIKRDLAKAYADHYALYEKRRDELFRAIEVLERLDGLYRRGILVQKSEKFPPEQDRAEIEDVVACAERVIAECRYKVKRNFENYATRHEAFLVYQKLHDSRKCPYWFEGKHQKSAFVVDFDEWLWLPAQDSPAYPVEWKKVYLQGFDEEEEA